jgi:ABC-type uncharacterized transport system permease subunit
VELKYTILELSQEIKRSRPVTEKWAVRLGFESTTKLINGKEVKAYNLSERQLIDLKHALGEDDTIEAEYEPRYEPTTKQPENSFNPADLVNAVNEIHRENNKRLESYMDRALLAEAQQKLITTSEASKDNEIYRLQAELKQALSRIETLENEKLKQKSFFGIKY